MFSCSMKGFPSNENYRQPNSQKVVILQYSRLKSHHLTHPSYQKSNWFYSHLGSVIHFPLSKITSPSSWLFVVGKNCRCPYLFFIKANCSSVSHFKWENSLAKWKPHLAALRPSTDSKAQQSGELFKDH